MDDIENHSLGDFGWGMVMIGASGVGSNAGSNPSLSNVISHFHVLGEYESTLEVLGSNFLG